MFKFSGSDMSQYKKNSFVVGVLLFFLVAVFIWWNPESKPEQYTIAEEPLAGYTEAGKLKYTVKVHNAISRPLPKSEIRLFLPVKSSESQWVGNISANLEYKILKDEIGNQVAYFRFEDLKPGDDRDLSLDIDVLRSLEPVQSSLVNVIPYLSDNTYLNIRHTVVVELAAMLKGEAVEQTVVNTLAWLSENIRPEGLKKSDELTAEDKQAPTIAVKHSLTEDIPFAFEVLDEKVYSELGVIYAFTALARANSVPVRFVVGLDAKELESGAMLSFNDVIGRIQFFDSKYWRSIDLSENKILTPVNNFQSMRYLTDLPGPEFLEPARMLYEVVGIDLVRGSEKISVKQEKM